MPQPERLGREMVDSDLLLIDCRSCAHLAVLSRPDAMKMFGDDAGIGTVREAARCPRCGKGGCGINLVRGPMPGAGGARPARAAAILPIEKITFAVCCAAGWTVHGRCTPCRLSRDLYSAEAAGPPKHPYVVIGRAFARRKLVCSVCRTPFSSVTISRRHPPEDIARWPAVI